MKTEVLEALQEINVNSEDFEFDGETWSTCEYTKQIETENYWIDIDFSIMVTWISYKELIYDSIDVKQFKVWDKLGNEQKVNISDQEIENYININIV